MITGGRDRSEPPPVPGSAEGVDLLGDLTVAAAELMPVPVVVVAPDGVIAHVNAVLTAHTGCPAAELIGQRWPDAIVVDADRAAARELLDAGPRSTGRGCALGLRGAAGELIVEWRARDVRGPDGAVLGRLLVGHDVTEREATEDELRRKAFQFEQSQRLARVGTSLVDVRTGAVTYSDEVYRILELDRATTPSPIELVPELAHPADLAEITGALHALFADNEPLDVVCRAILPSGRTKHVRMQGRVIRDVGGEVEFVVGAIHDVTDQVRAELELRQTLDRFEHAQSLADLGTWTRDVATETLRVSDAMTTVFEMSREDLASGRSFERVHPVERDEVEAMVRRMYEQHVPYDRAVRLVMPDGSLKHIRATGKLVFGADGEPLTAIGATQDITREVETADRLRSIAERLQEAESVAQIGSWEFVNRTRELNWSDELYRILELDQRIEPRYERFLTLVHPDDRADTEERHRASVANRTVFDVVNRLLMPDGRLKWVRQRGHTTYDEHGNPMVSLGTVQDITRTHIAELEVRDLNIELERRIEERTEELFDALKSAEAASRAKSAFLASMSHELRTPLNAVMGYAQLMELDSRLPADLHENVAIIRQAGQQLLSLIGDVIDLARVESGNLGLDIAWVDLAEVLSTCVAHAQPAAGARRVSIRVEPPPVAIEVECDRLRLTQVLNNLISNAVKYNEVGGDVAISAVLHDREVRIAVADSGIGFDPARSDELFEPFNRLGQEMGAAEGTGIGLAISRYLVREMGGSIGFESEPGSGSTFWVDLPGRVVAPG